MENQLDYGIHFGVPEAVYRADPGYNQSTLKKFGSARTPAHYQQELKDDAEKEEPDYLRIGRMVDASVLSGDPSVFVKAPANYPVKPTKDDPRTEKPFIMSAKWCRDWVEQQRAAGKTVMRENDQERSDGCIAAIKGHEDCWGAIKSSQHQVTVIARHPDGYRLKGRYDMWPKRPGLDWKWDLKTGRDASEEGFNHSAFDCGYNIQAEFYMMLAQLSGSPANWFGFFVVESEPPHGIQSFYTKRGSEECTRAAVLIERWLPAYDKCVTTNSWPCYPADWRQLKFKPWQLQDSVGGERLV